MANVAAIKVIIGLRDTPDGGHEHDHPNWLILPVISGGGKIRDHMLSGWVYDKKAGHIDDDAPFSPVGKWIGMHLVSVQFATEAVAQYPALVTRVTEAEFQDFYDNRSRILLPDERSDWELLNTLKIRRDLLVATDKSTQAIDKKIRKALNPESLEPGVTKNKLRRWATAKVKLGFTVLDP